MSALYSYIGVFGEVVTLAATQINFRSAWSGTTSYAKLDAVSYNSRWFIAVTAHTGVTPPTTFTIETPIYWSPLVLVEGDPQTLDTASEIAAAAAVGIATAALETAWAGTDTANAALALAATGTDAADQAYSLAQQALEAVWAGTDSSGVLRYRANLTQEGNDAPVANVFQNTFPGDVVWSYLGTGNYAGSLADAFPPERTQVFANSHYASAQGTVTTCAVGSIDGSDDSVVLAAAVDGVLTDGVLNNSVEIVYTPIT